MAREKMVRVEISAEIPLSEFTDGWTDEEKAHVADDHPNNEEAWAEIEGQALSKINRLAPDQFDIYARPA